MPWAGHKERPLDGDRYDSVVESCEAAREMLPPGWSGDQAYHDVVSDDCCWGAAPFILGEAGKEHAMPPAFWAHLATAADALGDTGLAVEFRARISN